MPEQNGQAGATWRNTDRWGISHRPNQCAQNPNK